MTPDQCRAARGLLDWSQDRLATEAKASNSTVRNFEKGRSVPGPIFLQSMKSALEAAGIQFIPANGGGPGVRLKG